MKVKRVQASFLLLVSILLGGASGEKSSDSIVEDQVRLLKKGEWVLEVYRFGGFSPRIHHFILSSDALFTVLSSSPVTKSNVSGPLFKKIAEMVPEIFDVKISTDAFVQGCMDCIETTLRVWQLRSDGKTALLEQEWNDGGIGKVPGEIIKLYNEAVKFQKLRVGY